jgi:chromosome segregation ATPase
MTFNCDLCEFCEPRKSRCRKLESLPMVGEYAEAKTCPMWCPLTGLESQLMAENARLRGDLAGAKEMLQTAIDGKLSDEDENARLRGEVEKYKDSAAAHIAEADLLLEVNHKLTADLDRVARNAAAKCGGLQAINERLESVAKRIMRQDATFLANEHEECIRLTADLARVTAERDDWRKAASAVLAEFIYPEADSVAVAALRAAVARKESP